MRMTCCQWWIRVIWRVLLQTCNPCRIVGFHPSRWFTVWLRSGVFVCYELRALAAAGLSPNLLSLYVSRFVDAIHDACTEFHAVDV